MLTLFIPLALTLTPARTGVDTYNVVVLTPNATTRHSLLYGGGSGFAAGFMRPQGVNNVAGLWRDDFQTFHSLHPAGHSNSRIWAAHGYTQVGDATVGTSGPRAGFWRSTAQSFQKIQWPTGYQSVELLATRGPWIVGTANFVATGRPHAARWNTDGTGFVSMNPPNFTLSRVYGTDGVVHVGTGEGPSGGRALMWKDSPIPFLQIPSAWLYGAGNGEQVGARSQGGAGFWRGTAESYTSLDYAPFGYTMAIATNGYQQVGYRTLEDSKRHALVWTGTPESVVNLHELLPPEYSWSTANAIDEDGNVYGHATIGTLTQEVHAVIWKRNGALVTLLPGDYTVTKGTPTSGHLGDIQFSNDTHVSIRSDFSGARLQPNMTIEVRMPAGVSNASKLTVRSEASLNEPPASQTTELWNWSTSSWDLVGTTQATLHDQLHSVDVVAGVASYLAGGEVRVRISWTLSAGSGSRNVQSKLDDLRVVLTP